MGRGARDARESEGEMKIRIWRGGTLDEAVQSAIEQGFCGDIEVLAEIAGRYPGAVFYREDLGGITNYSAREIVLAYERGIALL